MTPFFNWRRQIKADEEHTNAASELKISVRNPEGDKKDLYELHKGLQKEGTSFDLSGLTIDYGIDEENPVCVELPGK